MTATIVSAQQGIGTDEPNKSAALEIKSEKRGLLIPRVELQDLTDYSPIVGDEVNSLLVFNTTDDENLSPGFYYWEEGSWKRLLVDGDISGDVEAFDLTSNNETIIITNGEGATLTGVQIDINPSLTNGQYLKTENDEVVWADINVEEVEEADLELEDGVLMFLDDTDGENRLLNAMAKIGIAAQGITPVKIAPGQDGQVLQTIDGEVSWEDLEDINIPTGNLTSSNTQVIQVENGADAVFHNTQINLIAGNDGEVLMSNNDTVGWSPINNLAIEPWQIQGTTDKATENDQNIYQEGRVAIGKTDGFNENVTLDVAGAIRGGDPDLSATIGENSFAIGKEVVAEGKYSMAMGYGSEAKAYGSFAGGGFQNTDDDLNRDGGIAEGQGSFAFGRGTKTNESYSVAFGYNTKAEKIASVALGRNNEAKGSYSFVMGRYLRANSAYNTVFGQYNAIKSGSTPNSKVGWEPEDPVFEIGNGTGFGLAEANNALTILKKGWMGVGIIGVNNDAKPTEMLDIGNNPDVNATYEELHKVKVRDLPRTEGDVVSTTPDKIVTVNADGVLRSVNASELGGNDDVELQGPWLNQSDDSVATENDEDIYQMGNVAIGKTTGFNDDVALDVVGAVRGGNPDLTADIGTNSFAVGHNVVAIGDHSVAFGHTTKANKIYSVAFGRDNEADETGAVVMGRLNKASGNYSVAFGEHNISKPSFSTVIGSANAITGVANSQSSTTGNPSGEQLKDPLFQIGNGTVLSQNNLGVRSNAMTVLKNSKVGIGISGTEAAAKPTAQLDIGNMDGKGDVRIRKLYDNAGDADDKIVVVDQTGVLKSIDRSDLESEVNIDAGNGLTLETDNRVVLGGTLENDTEINTDSHDLKITGLADNATVDENTRVMVVGSDGTLQKAKSMMPKYFHMPAVVMPLTPTSTTIEMVGVSYNSGSEIYTIDLHEIYQSQFGGLVGTTSWSSPGAGTLPVLSKTELYYHITYYDPDVFDIQELTDQGVLTYKILNNANDASSRTYMNIVFEIKD